MLIYLVTRTYTFWRSRRQAQCEWRQAAFWWARPTPVSWTWHRQTRGPQFGDRPASLLFLSPLFLSWAWPPPILSGWAHGQLQPALDRTFRTWCSQESAGCCHSPWLSQHIPHPWLAPWFSQCCDGCGWGSFVIKWLEFYSQVHNNNKIVQFCMFHVCLYIYICVRLALLQVHRYGAAMF